MDRFDTAPEKVLMCPQFPQGNPACGSVPIPDSIWRVLLAEPRAGNEELNRR